MMECDRFQIEPTINVLASFGRHSFYANKRNYDQMAPWLPEQCGALLDVGSGLACIDAFVAHHWKLQPRIYLLDGDGQKSNRMSGYGIAKPWNAVSDGADFLRTLGVHSVVALQPPEWPEEPLDLVISLISWCHHYPVEVYLDRVYKSLRSRARLIVDVRKNTTGGDVLSGRFRFLGEVGRTAKTTRMAFEK